jgi:peptidoglycan-N-acetylglucosamine deacetylase
MKKFLLAPLFIALSAIASPKIEISITFDDLPAAGSDVPDLNRSQIAHTIIATLKKHKIENVYGFVNGILAKNMQERLDILATWKKAGFLVGNHTYSHKGLTATSLADFIKDLEENEPILSDFAENIYEYKILRYPYLEEGDSHDKRYGIRNYLNKRNYRVAPVSIDFEDWNWNDPWIRCHTQNKSVEIEKLKTLYLKVANERLNTANQLAMRIYQRPIKQVLLLHFSAVTADFLDALLFDWEKRGAKWITLAEATKDPAYSEDTVNYNKLGQPFLSQILASRKENFKDISLAPVPRDQIGLFCGGAH